MMRVNEKNGDYRVEFGNVVARMFMEYVVASGRIELFKHTTLEKDQEEHQDFEFQRFGGTLLTNQFKLRQEIGRTCSGVCQDYPFCGNGHPNTKIGRDALCILNGDVDEIWTAVQHPNGFCEIYGASIEKYRKKYDEIIKVWSSPDVTRGFSGYLTMDKMTPDLACQALNEWGTERMIYVPEVQPDVSWEVWWKKNKVEKKGPKIIFYISHLIKEWSWEVPADVFSSILKDADEETLINLMAKKRAKVYQPSQYR